MVRKFAKKTRSHEKFEALVTRYKVPRESIAINRRSISRAVAIGLFFSLMPMPFQMAAVLALLPFISFNVPFALLLVWISNPLTMPFIFYVEYVTGNFLLMRTAEETADGKVSMAWFESNFDAIVVPLYTGALFYGVTVSVAAYLLINYLWIRSVHEERRSNGSGF